MPDRTDLIPGLHYPPTVHRRRRRRPRLVYVPPVVFGVVALSTAANLLALACVLAATFGGAR